MIAPFELIGRRVRVLTSDHRPTKATGIAWRLQHTPSGRRITVRQGMLDVVYSPEQLELASEAP